MATAVKKSPSMVVLPPSPVHPLAGVREAAAGTNFPVVFATHVRRTAVICECSSGGVTAADLPGEETAW